MSRRAILALSGALSAFVLILGGAAAGYGLRSRSAPAGASEGVPVDVVRAREAEYLRLLDEAGARLRAQQEALAAEPAAEQQRSPSAGRSFERERDSDRASHGRHKREWAAREDDDG